MQFGSIHKYRACQDNCSAQAAFYKTKGGIWILITSCVPESRTLLNAIVFIHAQCLFFSMHARSDMSSPCGCGQEISESLTIRSEKLGRTKSSKRKQPGLEEGVERDASSRTISGDLTLWLSARRHKSQIGRTQTHTDRWKPHHGPWKSPPVMSIMDRSDAWDHFRLVLRMVLLRTITNQRPTT